MAILDSPNLTEHPLLTTFKGDIFFTPILNHLLGKSTGNSIAERRKAMHRAEGFMLEGKKLWHVSSKAGDHIPRTECIPTTSGFQQALDTHTANGHFSTKQSVPSTTASSQRSMQPPMKSSSEWPFAPTPIQNHHFLNNPHPPKTSTLTFRSPTHFATIPTSVLSPNPNVKKILSTPKHLSPTSES